MEDIELTFRELYVYAIIGGAILGALLGLIPLILGRRRNRRRLGFYGLVASTVGGAISPLLSIVVVAIFTWLVVRAKPVEADSHPEANSGDQDLASE